MRDHQVSPDDLEVIVHIPEQTIRLYGPRSWADDPDALEEAAVTDAMSLMDIDTEVVE